MLTPVPQERDASASARRFGFAKDRLRALALVALQSDGRGWGGEGLLAEVFEEGGGEVALAGAGDDDDDEFAGVAGLVGDLEGGEDGGAGGDSCEDAFFSGEAAGHGEGFVVGDFHDFVDEVGLEDFGD